MKKENSVGQAQKQQEKVFVNSNELQNLKIRKGITESKEYEAFLLRSELQMYISGLLKKYKTDESKTYNIAIDTGEITEQIDQK